METLSNQQVLDAELSDWRKLAQGLWTRYQIADYAAGARFVTAVAQAAEAAHHHPDLKLSFGVVDVMVCTHENGLWVTQADVELARTISALAGEQGLTADPSAVTQIELALDTAHEGGVAPFWAALLTGSTDSRIHDSVLDTTGRVPGVWFQSTDGRDPARQRWHVDLWLAPEVADDRIAAAVAAGGLVVDDTEAPSFTVLADTDGNRVCICSSAERE